jgi:hypothetical protein
VQFDLSRTEKVQEMKIKPVSSRSNSITSPAILHDRSAESSFNLIGIQADSENAGQGAVRLKAGALPREHGEKNCRSVVRLDQIYALAHHFVPGRQVFVARIAVMRLDCADESFEPQVVEFGSDIETGARVAFAKSPQLGIGHTARVQHQIQDAGPQQMPLRNHVGINEAISDNWGAGKKVLIESIEEGGVGTASTIALHHATSSVHDIPLSKKLLPCWFYLQAKAE